MRLNDDLRKNVEVFKRLTGINVNGGYSVSAKPDFPEVKSAAEGYEPVPFAHERELNPAVQSFSLSYGTRVINPPPQSLSVPPPVEYPEIGYPETGYPQAERRRGNSVTGSDSMDMFYHSLELDARMSSQLLREGDFYE